MKANIDTMASPDHVVINNEILGFYSSTDMMDIKAEQSYGEYAWFLTSQATYGYICRFNISNLSPDYLSKIYYYHQLVSVKLAVDSSTRIFVVVAGIPDNNVRIKINDLNIKIFCIYS